MMWNMLVEQEKICKRRKVYSAALNWTDVAYATTNPPSWNIKDGTGDQQCEKI